jgi:hypothetical protein
MRNGESNKLYPFAAGWLNGWLAGWEREMDVKRCCLVNYI